MSQTRGSNRPNRTRRIRTIHLADEFYTPRSTVDGDDTYCAMPFDDAVDYVTDGQRWGIRRTSGRVRWQGPARDLPELIVLEPVEEQGEMTLFRVCFFRPDRKLRSTSPMEVLWSPLHRRASVNAGRGSARTDANSPQEAAWRFLLDRTTG
jgi:hypothetical protein